MKRAVTLKARVTERYKESMFRDLEENLKRVELELQQLEFQSKRYLLEAEKQGPEQAGSIRQQLKKEKQKRVEFRERMKEKQVEVSQWEIGSEVVQGTLEGMVELAVGDTTDRLLHSEIIVQDGVIVEIRNG